MRKNGKATHQTLYSLGKVQDYTSEQLSRIGNKLKEAAGELSDLISVEGHQLEELGRYNYGFYLVYHHVMGYYSLPKVFERIAKRRKLSFNLYNAVLLMLIERLHDPVSKRGNYFNQEDYLGIAPVKLQHLYRSLDYLAENQRYLQQHIFQTNHNLFNQHIDVVFYDVTTFYFESEIEQTDALRQKGFSKDGKIGRTQVVFGLMIDKDKNPIGYQLYKGNTFTDMLDKLKDEYQIDQVVIVADRGMLSEPNREAVHQKGYEFILGERLKKLPKAVKAPMLDLSTYELEWVSSAQDPVMIRYKIFQHEDRKIITTYSQKRAEKDKKDREERIAKAEQLLKHPSGLKNKARRFYIKQEGEDQYVLDQQKIDNAAKYDGFLAITTNTGNIHAEQVLDHYHHLFQVEHSFRTFKSYLETRPCFTGPTNVLRGTFACVTYLMCYSIICCNGSKTCNH